MSRYHVLNEHTLCYAIEGSPLLGVLAGKVVRGGYDCKNGPISPVPSDVLRQATVEDFNDYRVSPKGHIA